MNMQTLYGLLYLEINLAASLLVLFIRIKTIGICSSGADGRSAGD